MEEIFSYALRKYLDEGFPEISRSYIMEDGISLSSAVKPFATIEYLGSNDELIAAGRRSYEETHRYQLGLFAGSKTELVRLSERMKNIVRQPYGIPLYNMQTKMPTGDRVLIDVSEFSPMASSDASNETYQHRGYFVAEIEVLRNVGESSFTQ